MADSRDVPQSTTRIIDFKSIVRRLEGKNWTKPETAYVFSNGRRFNNTDEAPGGPYGDEAAAL